MKQWITAAAVLFLANLWAADKVLTVGLGDEFYYGTSLDNIRTFYRAIKGKGINISWTANPGNWEKDVLNHPKRLQFYRDAAEIVRKNGIGVAMGLAPATLLPVKNAEHWHAAALNPKTGRRLTRKDWDFANPLAMKELEKYYARYMKALKPREIFFVDELILISPGENAHIHRMSAYWTSPTYSETALKSFRSFLRKRNFPGADQAKFPVTTREVKANPKANMGLPAIPLDSENRTFLEEDNQWPDSPLWQAWYEWRENLLARVCELQIRLAEDIFSDNPDWQGTMVSAPDFWFCRETGLNPARIAEIPQLKYLVAGYMGSHNVAKLKPSALKNGKLPGGMVELTCYGSANSVSKEQICKNFARQVREGARLMLFYPLANFNQKRTSEKLKKIGMDYRPEQVKAWEDCILYLQRRNLAFEMFSMKK